MSTPIDLRSDTVTRPTPAMRQAMLQAEVGDDVYGEDPTVNRLEALACELTGAEAALFVVSGTMANQLAIRVHTQPGDEALLDARAHPLHHEAGGAAVFSGVTLMPLASERGFPAPEVVEASVRTPTRYHARTRLLLLENTHNAAGGTVLPLAHLDALRAVAERKGLAVHMDGARVFNASVASGVPVREYFARVDTLSFCLSKGLGAPVGSVLCGPADKLLVARRLRTALGGAWRQAGMLAAAGLHALTHHVGRLADDHAHARRLAEAIQANPRFELVQPPETNIVVWQLADRAAWPRTRELLATLEATGLRLGLIDDHHLLRAVTHLDVSAAQIERAASILSAT
jgi:threonine aldolase